MNLSQSYLWFYANTLWKFQENAAPYAFRKKQVYRMKQKTFGQYRAIDLGIMAVLLLFFEMITATAATKWFPLELYTLSPTITIVCIVMMRWSGYAVIHAVVGGAAFCFASGASPEQFAIYCIGNCAALVAMLFFKAYGKEQVRSKTLLAVLFAAAAYFGAQLGRWLVALIFGASLDSLVMFLTTDSLSLLFAVVLVLIARRADGLFEDQKAYLIRTEEERRREQNERNQY